MNVSAFLSPSREPPADCEAQRAPEQQFDIGRSPETEILREGARATSPRCKLFSDGAGRESSSMLAIEAHDGSAILAIQDHSSSAMLAIQKNDSSAMLAIPTQEGFARQLSRTSTSLAARRSTLPSIQATSEREDAWQGLSVVAPKSASKDFSSQSSNDHKARPGFPLPLMALVTLLASLAGFVVVGFGKAVIYAGCPLGINGCNWFYDYEDKSAKLIKALDGVMSEEVTNIMVAALGALIVIQFVTRLPVELAFQICGGGTLQSLESVAVGYVIPLPAAALRFVCSVLYSGTGGPLGMEGPVIQICTILATNAGWALGIRAGPTVSVLASLGFAAGFSASFNSPLAGILFVVEELQHVMSHFSRGMEVMVLIASIAPTVVYRACKGNSQHFYPRYGPEIEEGTKGGSLDRVFGEQLWMLIAIPIAMLCCLVNLAIILGLRYLNIASEILHRRLEWLPITVTFVTQAIVVACIGAAVFQITGLRGIWGIGAESVQKALTEDFKIFDYFLFGFAKCFVMVIAVTFRAPGDILEPVLITGAFVGGGVGRCLVVWFGLGVEVMTPSIIFGMVGLFASCFRFPLTPVVIVIEVMGTEAYALVIPMVLSSFTAVIMSSRICHPILAEIMQQDGIDLHGHGAHKRHNHEEEEAEEDSIFELEKASEHSHSTQATEKNGSKRHHWNLDGLGGMFTANINALTSGEGLSHDYAFNRQESPESNVAESSVAPISPRSPKPAWSDGSSPISQGPPRTSGGLAARRNRQLGALDTSMRQTATEPARLHPRQRTRSLTDETPSTAVAFLRRQNTRHLSATSSQGQHVEPYGSEASNSMKGSEHSPKIDPEQGG